MISIFVVKAFAFIEGESSAAVSHAKVLKVRRRESCLPAQTKKSKVKRIES